MKRGLVAFAILAILLVSFGSITLVQAGTVLDRAGGAIKGSCFDSNSADCVKTTPLPTPKLTGQSAIPTSPEKLSTVPQGEEYPCPKIDGIKTCLYMGQKLELTDNVKITRIEKIQIGDDVKSDLKNLEERTFGKRDLFAQLFNRRFQTRSPTAVLAVRGNPSKKDGASNENFAITFDVPPGKVGGIKFSDGSQVSIRGGSFTPVGFEKVGLVARLKEIVERRFTA